MRGRPKRQNNSALIDSLQNARRQAGASYARIAELAGVSTSTLTRSIRCGGFSEDLAARVKTLLERGIPEPEWRSRPTRKKSNPPRVTSDALLILQKFFDIVPELESAFKTIFESSTARRQEEMHD